MKSLNFYHRCLVTTQISFVECDLWLGVCSLPPPPTWSEVVFDGWCRRWVCFRSSCPASRRNYRRVSWNYKTSATCTAKPRSRDKNTSYDPPLMIDALLVGICLSVCLSVRCCGEFVEGIEVSRDISCLVIDVYTREWQRDEERKQQRSCSTVISQWGAWR